LAGYVLNGQKLLRELTVEETVSKTFNLYLNNFVLFFVPFLINSLVNSIMVSTLLDYVRYIETNFDFGAPADEIWLQFSAMLSAIMLVFFLFLLVLWITTAVTHGICIKYASNLMSEEMPSFNNAFSFAIRKLPSLLIATLIVDILVIFGLIAFIVPGVILGIMYFLVVPVILNENIGTLSSLSRSKFLANGRWFKTFTVFLIVGIVVAVASSITGLIAMPFGDFSYLASSILTALFEPLLPIALAVHYFSMRGKEEQQSILPPPPPF
jgi:hypothetical protein